MNERAEPIVLGRMVIGEGANRGRRDGGRPAHGGGHRNGNAGGTPGNRGRHGGAPASSRGGRTGR
jgi:ATP-dependent RNA helicase RhlE